MTRKTVPLDRSFSPVSKTQEESDEREIMALWGRGNCIYWPEIENEYRCVILAEGGAGKTYEMMQRARFCVEQGRIAFFVRIEDIDIGFESAFEVGDTVLFDRWLTSNEEAWFYLDSVDEARLESSKAFQKAIRTFATRIKMAQHRAHVFISSRPYAWRSHSDRALVDKYLPFEQHEPNSSASLEETIAEVRAERSLEFKSALKIFSLDALEEEDIRTFAEHFETKNIDKLIYDLKRANLMELAGRPFDLEGILAKWDTDQALEGRLELLRHNIDLRLTEIDPDRARRQPLNKEKAREGARILAAAVILTGEAGIRVPDATINKTEIDAEAVLADWHPQDVQALLERGIFNDVLFGLVRFRHREVRELLAAEWLNKHLQKGNSRLAIESLLFREQYGEKIITPRLRPLLPWLILFDDQIRSKILMENPQVAVEGGDASRLPFFERQTLLRNIVKRLLSDAGDRSSQNNDAIARIAQPDLASDALQLIIDHQDNDEIIFFLGRLVWQGEMVDCVPALLKIAINPDRGIHARIAATRAVITCGNQEQKENLWSSLNALQNEIPRRLLSEIVLNTTADIRSVTLLLASIPKLTEYKRFEVSGLTQGLREFIDKLPISSSGTEQNPISLLIVGLNVILDSEPYLERRECHVSKIFAWLLGPALHAVERLVSNHSQLAFQLDALAIMVKMPVARFWRESDSSECKGHLDDLVPEWPELNDALFWQSIDEARARLCEKKAERLVDDSQVQWLGHFWKFNSSSFQRVLHFIQNRSLEDDKLVAVSLAYRLLIELDMPSDKLEELQSTVRDNPVLAEFLDNRLSISTSEATLEWQKRYEIRSRRIEMEDKRKANFRAEWITQLKANPDLVRSPPGLTPGEFSSDQYYLLGEIEESQYRANRSKGADWKALVKDFGADVARAYRDAAISHWRNFKPGLRSQGDDTNSIPYSLIFAMAGLQIESLEVSEFPNHLSENEIRHALRYITWELNGFPRWLESVYRAFPEIALDAVLTELHWELANTSSDEPMHYILHDLVYSAPWLHSALVGPILDWLECNEISSGDPIRHCFQILSGDADPTRLAKLSQNKILAKRAGNDLPFWYALWVGVDAEKGIPAVSKWLESQPLNEASQSAQVFITILLGGCGTSNAGLNLDNFQEVRHLKSLYLLMHHYIQVKDDVERVGKGVYSPGLRDDAQDARNRLLNLLSERPGKETYTALSELMSEHPESEYRSWMANRAYHRAEEDADIEPWSVDQVREFNINRTRTPTTNRQLFDLTVYRLNDLKNWVECGNDSPYKTWQKADSEPEMRNLIAGWLNDRSENLYRCAQENELANKQRPDIWMQCSNVVSPIPIELKLLDQGWTGPNLCERLRNQLAGDYLREESAGSGVMLLVFQGRKEKKYWQIGSKRVDICNLRDALKHYWESISGKFPRVAAIEVVVFDLTVRETKSNV